MTTTTETAGGISKPNSDGQELASSNGAHNGTSNGVAGHLAASHGSSRGSIANGCVPEAADIDEEAPHTPDVRPDVRQTVVVAAATASERQMPLRPEAVTSTNNGSATSLGFSPSDIPQTPPWHLLSAALQANLREVDIMDSMRIIEAQMKAVDKEIERLITTPVKLVADLASHTLGAGGKRLRPALTILAAQLCGDSAECPNPRTITCAAAVELMHTTALIHDDVVDSAATRRGKPAANLIWGNETSVLVGDYLFAQVFVTVAQGGYADLMPVVALATSQLCAGELLETQTRGNLGMKEKQYREIIALKTAALTDCACRLGAMAAGGTTEQVERTARFGRDIGMAFQIVDDVFDIVSTEGRVGKPVGNDIREGDITLPMLRAMQVLSGSEKSELRGIVGKDPISDEEVARALELLRGCDAVDYSLRVAADFIVSAKAQLDVFEASPARVLLFDIADYVLSRDK